MKRFVLSLLFMAFFTKMIAQITFIGFSQPQCGLISNHGYTFENIFFMCSSHSHGYKVYLNGIKVYEKCEDFSACSIVQLKFINETTGFLVEKHPNGHAVYKTIDSGTTWSIVGGGTPNFGGLYLVNSNTGYIVTTWNTPIVYISRFSDIGHRSIVDNMVINDSIITDTIFGEPFCSMNNLDFKVLNGTDTVSYRIEFNIMPLSIPEYRSNSGLKVFPNPAQDYIQIDIDPLIMGSYSIFIYDNVGCIVKELKLVDTNKVYIGDLKTGIYLLKMYSKRSVAYCKIIKY